MDLNKDREIRESINKTPVQKQEPFTKEQFEEMKAHADLDAIHRANMALQMGLGGSKIKPLALASKQNILRTKFNEIKKGLKDA